MPKIAKPLTAAAMMIGAALAGCSRSDDETPPTANAVKAEMPAAAKPVATPSPTPVAATPSPTAAANAGAEAPKEAPRTRDEQMMDDASATGMTARSSRDEQPAEDAAPEETGNQ